MVHDKAHNLGGRRKRKAVNTFAAAPMLAVAALGFALRDRGRRLADGSCAANAGGMSCASVDGDNACNEAQTNDGHCDAGCGGSCDQACGDGSCDTSCDGHGEMNRQLPGCGAFSQETSGGSGAEHYRFKYKDNSQWCGYSENSNANLHVMQSLTYEEMPKKEQFAAKGLWCVACSNHARLATRA